MAPPPTSAILYEIDDILTAIEHVIVSTLEDVGKVRIVNLDGAVLNHCRVILQYCNDARLALDGSHWSTVKEPVQGKWRKGDVTSYANADLMKIGIPDWIRRALIESIAMRSADVDMSMSKNVSSELHSRLFPLCAAAVSDIRSSPRSKDTKKLRDALEAMNNRITFLAKLFRVMPSPPSPRQHLLLTKVSDMCAAIQHVVLDFLEEVDALGPDVNYFSEREVFNGCNRIIDEIDTTMRGLHDINVNGITSRREASTMRSSTVQRPQYTSDINDDDQDWLGAPLDYRYKGNRMQVRNMDTLGQFSISGRMRRLLIDMTNFTEQQLAGQYRGSETRELSKAVSRFIIKIHELLPDAKRLAVALSRSQVYIELNRFEDVVKTCNELRSSQ